MLETQFLYVTSERGISLFYIIYSVLFIFFIEASFHFHELLSCTFIHEHVTLVNLIKLIYIYYRKKAVRVYVCV